MWYTKYRGLGVRSTVLIAAIKFQWNCCSAILTNASAIAVQSLFFSKHYQ
ncbi:hypothetical protein [Pelagibius sp.]